MRNRSLAVDAAPIERRHFGECRRHAGEVDALGTPVVSVRDGYTVVDVPVALEHADGIARVVLDADRQIAGFFVRPTRAVS